MIDSGTNEPPVRVGLGEPLHELAPQGHGGDCLTGEVVKVSRDALPLSDGRRSATWWRMGYRS